MPLDIEEYENALEVGDRVKIINTENVWEDKQGEIINKLNDDIYTVGVIFAPGKIVHQDFEKEHLELLSGGKVKMVEDYRKDKKKELDWDRLYRDHIHYDDLDLEVVDTFFRYTYDGDSVDWEEYGVIKEWDYDVEVGLEDIARYLKKKEEDITQKDIDNIDEEDFDDFLLGYYHRAALEDAAENHEVDDVYYYNED